MKGSFPSLSAENGGGVDCHYLGFRLFGPDDEEVPVTYTGYSSLAKMEKQQNIHFKEMKTNVFLFLALVIAPNFFCNEIEVNKFSPKTYYQDNCNSCHSILPTNNQIGKSLYELHELDTTQLQLVLYRVRADEFHQKRTQIKTLSEEDLVLLRHFISTYFDKQY